MFKRNWFYNLGKLARFFTETENQLYKEGTEFRVLY